MKAHKVLLGIALLAVMTFVAPKNSSALSQGDLGVYLFSSDISAFLGVVPGDTIHYNVMYTWIGNGPAPDVSVTFQPSSYLIISSVSVPWNSGADGALTWNLGTLDNYVSDTIEVIAVVKANVPMGTEIKCTASITGNVDDTDATDNTSEFSIMVVAKGPDLFVMHTSSLEPQFDSDGFNFAGEQGLPVDFSIMYWNMGKGPAPDVVLTEVLPEGFDLLSAEPTPTSVDGRTLTWELGALEWFAFGEIKLRALPTQSGLFTIRATITTTAEEEGYGGGETLPNESDYPVKIMSLFPPVVTNPSTSSGSGSFVVTPNPRIEGLVKAGATVTMYEGAADHFGNDISDLTPIGTAVAGKDRVWKIQPTQLTEARDYSLYFRAELEGNVSNLSQVVTLSVNTALAEAGFDMDGYSVTSGDNTSNPGGLGGTTGGVPGEDITITLRMTAPDEVAADSTLWGLHALKVTVVENENTYDATVPVSSVKYVGKDAAQCYKSWDFTYIFHGYGPGARITVKYRPMKYDCGTGKPEDIIGDDIKITEILIDPAGYVYDIEIAGREYTWPETPPENSLIENATVTAYERTGDTDWTEWDAASRGQFNPQVTDTVTEDKVKQKGYFAFFVPTGQYRVAAEAPEYAAYESPILTVINEPIYQNVGMRRSEKTQTGVKDTGAIAEIPKAFTLLRNFPNPFNPSTNILFLLPAKGFTTLTVYNLQGQKVRELLAKDMPAGFHTVAWDGRDNSGQPVSSGVYFSSLSSGRVHASGKMLLVK